MNRLCIAMAGIAFAISAAGTVNAELFGDYVGYKACMQCHADKVEGWKTTPHANAFEDLKKQGEEKQSVPGCVRCHVVGMDSDGGFIDNELTPELKNVQCESCHGPGRIHVVSGDPADIVSKPDETTCRTCHTEGQDKHFDYTKKSRFAHGVSKQGE